jgi:hypothetical protein
MHLMRIALYVCFSPCPACPVKSLHLTGVAPADGTGVNGKHKKIPSAYSASFARNMARNDFMSSDFVSS